MVHGNRVSEVIKACYERIARTEQTNSSDLPHSSVYYTRWVIWEKTGVWFTIEHVKVSMWLEGLVNPEDVKVIPEWYIKKYLGGVKPNMEVLRTNSKAIWDKHQEELNSEKGVDLPW